MRTLIALCALLTLGGCQVTVLENLPEGAEPRCASAVVGGFAGIDRDKGRDAAFGVYVDAQCAMTIYDREKDPKAAPMSVQPSFLEARGQSFVFISSDDAAKLEHVKPDETLGKKGWLPFRWSRDGDRIVLQSPDHRRVATLIVNGGLDGETQWSSPDSGSNLIRGTSEQLRAILIERRLFVDDDRITLRYVGKTRRELENALTKAYRADQAERRAQSGKRP